MQRKRRCADAAIAAVLALALSLAAGGCMSPPRESGEAVLSIFGENGTLLASLPLPEGTFTHHYIHSIHLTAVDEVFSIEGGKLQLKSVAYDTYGVGMPSDGGESFRLENGRFIVELHRTFDSVAIRVSHVPGHGVIVDGVLHPFTDWAPVEALITLRAIQ